MMILYHFSKAPNPLRVAMFLKEKNISVKSVEINPRLGENRSNSYLKINPKGTVPCLKLEDGSIINESLSICKYLDAIHPEPPLYGTKPKDKGIVDMWNRKIDFEGMNSIADIWRNSQENFVNRAVPDVRITKQIPELINRGKLLSKRFIEDIEKELINKPYIAGNFFSVADISLYVFFYFAQWVQVTPKEAHVNILNWKNNISKRDSVNVFPK